MWAKNKKSGFTIVELLIVIVVIAILAAITVVAYNGVQQRARDSERKTELALLAKSIKLYAVDTGNYATTGCGNGVGTGWLHYDYDGAGPLISINACLAANGHLLKPVVDPSGLNACSGLTCYAYMKASCTDGSTYLFAHLDSLPQTSTDLDATCVPTWDTAYGMNYVLRVN
ncbi:type II secretion system protein [Candidatus Saccharibacteria bacterium]|nr:type II secretion system protein [Candidatus Saccharibacteria bacterium]